MSSTHWAILKGSNSQHYLTQAKSRIGRDTNCNDVILLSQSISKKQCIINATDISNIVITDQNSRNGTFVNNQRIQNSTIKIKHGDIVRFGFDSNCYRLELSNKPPIDLPPPNQYRFDNLRRNENENTLYKSNSEPSKLRGNNRIKRNSSYLKGENRSAGFMMGSPPASPNKYGDSGSTLMINTETIHQESNQHHQQPNQDENNENKEIELKSNTINNENEIKEMRFLKDTILRLEDKINTITSISKENSKNQTKLSKQLNDTIMSPQNHKKQNKNNMMLSDTLTFNTPLNINKHNYPALVSKQTEKENINEESITFDKEKMENLKELQKKECEEKMQQFYDSVEKLSMDKSLKLLNIKIQFLVHLFKTINDLNEEVPDFLDFSTKYKQSIKDKRNKTDPSLRDFVKLLDYLNDIFDANQCNEISEFISSTKSEILLYKNKEKNDNILRYNRSIQIDDLERDNSIAICHSMKEYSNTLQIRLYQLKQILILKDEKINELNNKDWVRKLDSFKNLNASLNRQLLIQEKDLKRLYKMFSELSEKIDRNLPDSTILRSKINDFITCYNTKIFHLTSQLSELNRRKTEKNKKWSDINEKCRRYKNKITNLESIIKTQRETFMKTLHEKDLSLIKSNKQLSVLAGLNGTNDQEKAAKFLFETLQKYISENDKNKSNIEALETSLQIKIQEIQELQEIYQIKLDELRKNDNIQSLQQELREEREHFGAERISKLEKMLFELQTSLAQKTEIIANIQDENRKLSEKQPLNQVETIEFLSKTVYEKDEHINKLQNIIDSQTIKIKELNMIQQTLKDQTAKHQNEIQDIQEKHQRVNNILGNMKSIQTAANINSSSLQSLKQENNLFQSQKSDQRYYINNGQKSIDENTKWQNEIIDHDIDVSISNQ